MTNINSSEFKGGDKNARKEAVFGFSREFASASFSIDAIIGLDRSSALAASALWKACEELSIKAAFRSNPTMAELGFALAATENCSVFSCFYFHNKLGLSSYFGASLEI